MRGLDTNVLVRYLVTDGAKRTALAERLVEHSRGLGDPLYISIVVLCELAWVLTRSYGQARAEIIRILELILKTNDFCKARAEIIRILELILKTKQFQV